jgi:hypothetical protein
MEQVDSRVPELISAGSSPSSLTNTTPNTMNVVWKFKYFAEEFRKAISFNDVYKKENRGD